MTHRRRGKKPCDGTGYWVQAVNKFITYCPLKSQKYIWQVYIQHQFACAHVCVLTEKRWWRVQIPVSTAWWEISEHQTRRASGSTSQTVPSLLVSERIVWEMPLQGERFIETPSADFHIPSTLFWKMGNYLDLSPFSQQTTPVNLLAWFGFWWEHLNHPPFTLTLSCCPEAYL